MIIDNFWRDDMSNKKDVLVDMLYFDEGLITPGRGDYHWSQVDSGKHIKKSLDSMSDEDARIAKRKFRKLHRKARRESELLMKAMGTRSGWRQRQGGVGNQPSKKNRSKMVEFEMNEIQKSFGSKGSQPTVTQARHRRAAVFHTIRRKVSEGEK